MSHRDRAIGPCMHQRRGVTRNRDIRAQSGLNYVLKKQYTSLTEGLLPALKQSRSCEHQARSPSLCFTGKSEQKITIIEPFSLESTRKDGVISSCCSRRNALW